MKYEVLPTLHLPKIGFGTWTIGGRSTPDVTVEAPSLAALGSALELGYTHFDTAEGYAAGHCEELLGQAIRQAGLAREALFVTSKVSPEHLQYADVLHACETSLRRLGMDYLDLYLIHWPSPGMNLAETFRALNQLVTQGKVRRLGVSNFNLAQLQEALSFSATGILTDQVSYSLADRACVENGVLAYCQANDILLTAYSPVKRKDFMDNPALQSVSVAHGATPQQIALAWLAQQPRVITIPKSFSLRHQAENLAAADLVLSSNEWIQLEQCLPVL